MTLGKGRRPGRGAVGAHQLRGVDAGKGGGLTRVRRRLDGVGSTCPQGSREMAAARMQMVGSGSEGLIAKLPGP
jgi:hypothetical protein